MHSYKNVCIELLVCAIKNLNHWNWQVSQVPGGEYCHKWDVSYRSVGLNFFNLS